MQGKLRTCLHEMHAIRGLSGLAPPPLLHPTEHAGLAAFADPYERSNVQTIDAHPACTVRLHPSKDRNKARPHPAQPAFLLTP